MSHVVITEATSAPVLRNVLKTRSWIMIHCEPISAQDMNEGSDEDDSHPFVIFSKGKPFDDGPGGVNYEMVEHFLEAALQQVRDHLADGESPE